MGKRGPAPKGEFGDKSAVLSTRISSELRAALEASVEKTGLTLSREIEHRLRRTFQEEETIDAAWGSQQNYRLMQMAGLAIRAAMNPQNPQADWLSDPVAFEIAVRTVANILEAVRPPGGKPQLDPFAASSTISRAAEVWNGVQNADASLPLSDKGRKHLANRIKSDLGGRRHLPGRHRAYGSNGDVAAMTRRSPSLFDKSGLKPSEFEQNLASIHARVSTGSAPRPTCKVENTSVTAQHGHRSDAEKIAALRAAVSKTRTNLAGLSRSDDDIYASMVRRLDAALEMSEP